MSSQMKVALPHKLLSLPNTAHTVYTAYTLLTVLTVLSLLSLFTLLKQCHVCLCFMSKKWDE